MVGSQGPQIKSDCLFQFLRSDKLLVMETSHLTVIALSISLLRNENVVLGQYPHFHVIYMQHTNKFGEHII